MVGIEKKYQLLGAKNYRTKSLLLKATVVLMNVQDFAIDFFVTHHIFRCVTEEISAKTFGTIIKNLLVTIESLILGSIVLWVYIKDETNTVDASESYLDQDEKMISLPPGFYVVKSVPPPEMGPHQKKWFGYLCNSLQQSH